MEKKKPVGYMVTICQCTSSFSNKNNLNGDLFHNWVIKSIGGFDWVIKSIGGFGQVPCISGLKPEITSING